jgi:hypothetical protein
MFRVEYAVLCYTAVMAVAVGVMVLFREEGVASASLVHLSEATVQAMHLAGTFSCRRTVAR